LRTDFSRRGKPNGKARSQIVKPNDELVKVDYLMRKNGDSYLIWWPGQGGPNLVNGIRSPG